MPSLHASVTTFQGSLITNYGQNGFQTGALNLGFI